MPDIVRVMISSRCDAYTTEQGEKIDMPKIRSRIQSELEDSEVFGFQLFRVFRHESEPLGNHQSAWETCLREARKAHILLVLYNGHAGGGREHGLGICYAEVAEVVESQGTKVRVVQIPFDRTISKKLDGAFQAYMKNRVNYNGASTVEAIVEKAKEQVLKAVIELTALGASAGNGKHATGQALEWCQLDYNARHSRLLASLRRNLENQGCTKLSLQGRELLRHDTLLFECHAIPDRMTIAQARSMLGRPFLRDTELAPQLSEHHGPVHLVACFRNITEQQAKSVVGLDDLIVVTPGFGLYVVDRVHKIQMVFLANCRDTYCTDRAFRSFWQWLWTNEEGELLKKRAKSRSKVVNLLAKLKE
ncbi:MAG: hypothetical protein AB7S38_14590 [Vulcanimicrobiota bacterium]